MKIFILFSVFILLGFSLVLAEDTVPVEISKSTLNDNPKLTPTAPTDIKALIMLMDQTPRENWRQFLDYFNDEGSDAIDALPQLKRYYFQYPKMRDLIRDMIINLGDDGPEFLVSLLESKEPLISKEEALKEWPVGATAKDDDEKVKMMDQQIRKSLRDGLNNCGPVGAKFYPDSGGQGLEKRAWIELGDCAVYYPVDKGEWKPLPPFLQKMLQSSDPEIQCEAKELLVGWSGQWRQYQKPIKKLRSLSTPVSGSKPLRLDQLSVKRKKFIWNNLKTNAHFLDEGFGDGENYDPITWKEVFPLLKKALQTNEGLLQMNALYFIGEMGQAGAVFIPQIIPLLQVQKDANAIDADMPGKAASVLMFMGPKAAVAAPELNRFIAKQCIYPDRFKAWLRFFIRLGPVVIPYVVEYGKLDENKQCVCTELANHATQGWEAAIPYFQEMTKDRRLFVRRSAWIGLDNIEYSPPDDESK